MRDKLGLMKITHAAKKTYRPRQKTEKHFQIIYTVSVDFKNSELTHFVQIKTDSGETCWNWYALYVSQCINQALWCEDENTETVHKLMKQSKWIT